MPGWSRCLIVAHGSTIACTIPWTPGGEHGHERSRPQYQSDAGEPALRCKNPFRRIVRLAAAKALPRARTAIGKLKGKGPNPSRITKTLGISRPGVYKHMGMRRALRRAGTGEASWDGRQRALGLSFLTR
jgi:hypothetical protein